MRPIKLIVIAILIMLIFSTLAYFFVTNQAQDVFTDIIDPPESCDYTKYNYDWGTVWRNKNDYDHTIVWDENGNKLNLDWKDNTPNSVRTKTSYRQEGFGWHYYIEFQQRVGGTYHKLQDKETDNRYTKLSEHSGYFYPTIQLVKNNLNMEEDTWNWSICVMEKIQKGKA
jgi:uncharacterized protein YxeA